MSSHYNARYARSNALTLITLENDDGTPYAEIDLFDIRIHRLITSVKKAQPYTINQSEKLVNISYQAYNTTSLWWVLVLYNGLIHAYDIYPGMVLRIPDLFEITIALNQFPSRVGEVVEI